MFLFYFSLCVEKQNNNKSSSYCLILGLLLNERIYEINFINQIKNKNIIFF